MHIPDGVVSPAVLAGCAVFAAGGIALSLKKTGGDLEDKTVPLMGVLGAFLFAVQMVNFPILPGTSGHLLGGALAVLFLGPWAASLILSAVIIIQCFLFQDGGLTALGLNIFNMAYVGVFSAYGILYLMKKIFNDKYRTAAIFISGWFSVAAGSLFVAIELSLSGNLNISALFGTVIGIHVIIGCAEGAITCAIAAFLLKARPELSFFGGSVETS